MTPLDLATEFVKKYPNLFTEDREWWIDQITRLIEKGIKENS